MPGLEKIAVLGGGAWGTALALVAARAGRTVSLWARDAATVEAINTRRENTSYLPGIDLDPPVAATTDLSAALLNADAVLLVTPAQSTRAITRMIAPNVRAATPIVLCAKGIERGTGALLSDVITQETPALIPAVLSGPSFAADVARELPTAVTVAAADGELADHLSSALASATFRPYAATDLTGVQIGGALKNVLAIACGAVEGRGWGASARAALTARGFAELTRLGLAMGGARATLTGLSGLGDLVLTCGSDQSRNFAFGKALGAGASVSDVTSSGGKLAEGAHSAQVAVELGRRHGIELPITDAVSRILSGDLSLDAALNALMTRPLKREH